MKIQENINIFALLSQKTAKRKMLFFAGYTGNFKTSRDYWLIK
jgi:hypothetical protein